MTLQENLKGKKILFFSVRTFNLEIEIKTKLEELGAKVTFYDERPSNNDFVKGLLRINRNLFQISINNYYEKILFKVSNIKFDFLFVNRGEIVPSFFLERLRKDQPNCKFIYYTWDSFSNHPHPVTILKYFDRKFTFDSIDAVKYKINFRPLFFIDGFKNIKYTNSLTYKYDLLFIGTAHSDRYIISSTIVDFCKLNGLSSFCYYYMHGRLVYLYKYLFDKSFKKFDLKKLSFESLDSSKIYDLYKISNVILDINHPGQKGLTMRTFEAMGAGKKIITTNSEVKKYCFYRPSNILVIDREKIELSKSFFISNFEPVSEKIYDKMSIEGWLRCIFFDEDSDFWIKGIK
jgi:hypothetical protein